jgi:group I intron endonuclease
MHFWGHYIMNLLENMDHELWESKNVIYCYTNKINGKKYVGQTTKSLQHRHKQHIGMSNWKNNKNYNLPFYKAIRKYGIENFKLEVLERNKTLNELNLLERKYISKFNSLANEKNGYNVSDGGSNGSPLAGKSEEKINEWKRKISESKKGKYVGENSPSFGKRGKENKNSIPIISINIENKNIKYYESLSFAVDEGYDSGSICRCCKNVNRTHKGHVWMYYSDYIQNKDNIDEIILIRISHKRKKGSEHPSSKSIMRINLNNVNDKKIYNCIRSVEKDGFYSTCVSNCCRYYKNPEEFLSKNQYPCNSYKGYIWCYKEDYDKIEEEFNFSETSDAIKILPKTSRPIVGISLTKTNDILFYDYMNQAKNDGFNSSCISNCCKGKRGTHKGYKWYYKEDYDKMIKETD